MTRRWTAARCAAPCPLGDCRYVRACVRAGSGTRVCILYACGTYRCSRAQWGHAYRRCTCAPAHPMPPHSLVSRAAISVNVSLRMPPCAFCEATDPLPPCPTPRLTHIAPHRIAWDLCRSRCRCRTRSPSPCATCTRPGCSTSPAAPPPAAAAAAAPAGTASARAVAAASAAPTS